MNATDEWYSVTSVSDSVTQITETENVRMFLVEGTDSAVLVDAGRGIGDLRALVESLTTVPVVLFLTHWHWDHIGSASSFDSVRMDPRELAADGRVTIDAVTDEFVSSPAGFVDEWQADGKAFPDSFDPASFSIDPVPAAAVTPIEPGDTIDVGDREVVAVDLPGHSPGHLGLLDQSEGVLVGGDVIHLDRGLFLHFETGDAAACLDSFETLVELWRDGAFDTLVTGHNEPLRGDELELLVAFRDGLEAILADELVYDLVETGYGDARQYEIAGAPVLTKPEL